MTDQEKAHECETPLDGAVLHRWTCKVCGQKWIVADAFSTPVEYEKLEDFYD